MPDVATACAIAFKTTLLIAFVGVAAMAFARRSAAAGHGLWTVALVLSLLMPAAVVYLPAVSVVLPSWIPTFDGPWVIGQPEQEGLATAADASVFAWPTTWKVYVAGTLLFLGRVLLAEIGLTRWKRRARPLQSRAWLESLDRVDAEFPSASPLRVLESCEVAAPCTWGFLLPVLLLPTEGQAWTESERRHALLHELAHIRRHDYLSALLIRLACAVHWYNPLVWLAASHARRLREQACDDAVLSAGVTPSDYAQLLLDLSGRARGEWTLPAAMAVVPCSELHQRVIAILNPAKVRRPLPPWLALTALIPILCLTLRLAAAVPAIAVDSDPAPQASPADTSSPSPPAEPEPLTPALPATPAVPPVPSVPPVPPIPSVPLTLPDKS